MKPNIIDFYLALLSLQMAILGFVIAGVVTLMQILQGARPRRSIRLLASPMTLASYLGFLISLLLILSIGTWVIAFEVNNSVMDFFQRPLVAILLFTACLGGFAGFIGLIFKGRQLLDNSDYMSAYTKQISPVDIRGNLFKLYSTRPASAQEAWENKYKKIKHQPDPLAPIRDYVKDSALKASDYDTANGLNLFGDYFDRAFESIRENPETDEFHYLAELLHENSEEFFKLFSKLALEKHKAILVRLVQAKSQKFLNTPRQEGLLTAIKALEHLGMSGADEGEILMCIEGIHNLTTSYLKDADAQDRPWSEVGPIFEGACLAVARLGEAYYLQATNPLHAIPTLRRNNGEYRSVTDGIVEFFVDFKELADRFEDTYPEHYFEAIEVLTEVYLSRYAEIAESTQEKIGLGSIYRDLARELYGIYQEVGHDAIEHNKPALLELCTAHLTHIRKTAHDLSLTQEEKNLADMLKTLARKR